MSETFDHNGLPDDELLAAELCAGRARRRGRERLQNERATRDRGFARLVEDWEERLAPWAAEIAEIAPPPQVWDRISSALPAQPRAPALWHKSHFLAWSQPCGRRACRGLPRGPDLFWYVHPAAAARRNDRRRRSSSFRRHHRFAAAARSPSCRPPSVADATRVPELWLIPPDGKPRRWACCTPTRP